MLPVLEHILHHVKQDVFQQGIGIHLEVLHVEGIGDMQEVKVGDCKQEDLLNTLPSGWPGPYVLVLQKRKKENGTVRSHHFRSLRVQSMNGTPGNLVFPPSLGFNGPHSSTTG